MTEPNQMKEATTAPSPLEPSVLAEPTEVHPPTEANPRNILVTSECPEIGKLGMVVRGWAKNPTFRQPVRCTVSKLAAEVFVGDRPMSITLDIEGTYEFRRNSKPRPRRMRLQLSRALIEAIAAELHKPAVPADAPHPSSGSVQVALEAFRRRADRGAK